MWQAARVSNWLPLALLGWLLGPGLVLGPAFAQPALESVRIGEHPDKTRLVLELSEEPSYRVFTLPDPPRVVIDLPELEGGIEGEALPSSHGLITALRYGLFAPGTSRIVLDIAGPVGVKSVLVLQPQGGSGHRLVVDLQPIAAARFADPANRQAIVSRVPLPAPQTAALPVVPAVPLDKDRPTIVIDPGHGGVDPGAIGIGGTYEKTLVLAYAKELARQLEHSGDFQVVLTRDTDVFLPLRRRFAIAQEVGGDLFLSLHANIGTQDFIRGASIYTLSEQASDAEAAALAEKENLSDIVAGVTFSGQSEDVNMILLDLARRETMNLSKSFANMTVRELGRSVQLLRNTHRFAGFAVLKSPTVPSVLVEVGYISNKEEERLLNTAAHRAKLASAMIRAIRAYFEWQDGVRRS